MTTVRVAAVQAAYELMNREATLDRVGELTADAAARGAQLVVFPEVFVPGTPRGSISGSLPRSPWATAGSHPCSTSRARTGCTSSA